MIAFDPRTETQEELDRIAIEADLALKECRSSNSE